MWGVRVGARDVCDGVDGGAEVEGVHGYELRMRGERIMIPRLHHHVVSAKRMSKFQRRMPNVTMACQMSTPRVKMSTVHGVDGGAEVESVHGDELCVRGQRVVVPRFDHHIIPAQIPRSFMKRQVE